MPETGSQYGVRVGTLGLVDPAYDWRLGRRRAGWLAHLYELADYKSRAEKVAMCSTILDFVPVGEGERKLKNANFCRDRLCPICTRRKARKNAFRVSQVLDEAEKRHGCRYIMLTLTQRNVPAEQLGPEISRMLKAWDKYTKRRAFQRAQIGWFRAVEVTRNTEPGEWYGTYHPHVHVLLAVKPEYFKRKSGLYLTLDDYIRMWRESMGLGYDPNVDIEACKIRRRAGESDEDYKSRSAKTSAAKEASKYAVKDIDWTFVGRQWLPEAEAVEVVRTYVEALRSRRLLAFGGVLREIAKELGADKMGMEDQDDLVHIDEERIRDDVVQLIETYHWHFGAGDYVLVSVEEVSGDGG